MALVDVYDALVSDRPYKTAFTALESIDIIMAGSGKHFDPAIADIFFKIKDLFEKVR
jgi:putative two-component system response regulator